MIHQALQVDKRCRKWRLLRIDKWLAPAESHAKGLCRNSSAQQGGRGVCPEGGQVAPRHRRVLLNALGMKPLPVSVVPTLAFGTSGVSHMSGILLDRIGGERLGQRRSLGGMGIRFCASVGHCRESIVATGRLQRYCSQMGVHPGGNARVREAFRAHGVHVVAFPPHLMRVVQPVEVGWRRSFTAEFVEWFRGWASTDLKPFWSADCIRRGGCPKWCFSVGQSCQPLRSR
jgi:hypothetical protein